MRRGAIVVVLVAAAALVFLLWRSSGPERASRQEAAAKERAPDPGSPRGGPGAAANGGAKAGGEEHPGDGPRPPPSATEVHGRLLYEDGPPAAGIELQRALALPFRTRIYRVGDFPEKTVWLVADIAKTGTAADGSFRFPPGPAPPGARALLYTELHEPALVLAEDAPGGFGVVTARRRVEVTGTLLDAAGEPLADHWLGAQLGWPEDWTTRRTREKDSFANRAGALDLDPEYRFETVTGDDGAFGMFVAAGRNTFSFGDWGDAGHAQVDVPPVRVHDVGALRAGGADPVRREARELAGLVLDLAGRPLAGVEVLVWDGNKGPPSHEAVSGGDGRWRVEGLTGGEVIVWTRSTPEAHATLPEQCSGKVAMPAPELVLRAPSGGEYAWLRASPGFWLLERDGVLLWAGRVDGEHRVGMPPGRWRVAALLDAQPGQVYSREFGAAGGDEVKLP